MAALSDQQLARSRKIASLILQRLSSVGQVQLAEALGSSEASISRWKTDQIEQCAKALAVLGLKVVPEDARCYKPDAIEAIFTLARMQVESADVQSLVWEEPS